jgi:hypothetical protein
MTTPSIDTLDDLAHEIVTRFDRADAAATKSHNHRVSAGELLVEVRGRVDAGEAGPITWTEWCAVNVPNRSMRDIRRCLALVKADDPDAALEAERANNRVAKQASRQRTDCPVEEPDFQQVTSTVTQLAGDEQWLLTRFMINRTLESSRRADLVALMRSTLQAEYRLNRDERDLLDDMTVPAAEPVVTEPPETVAPITEPPRQGISFFITQAQKRPLRELGISDDVIRDMKPADAHQLLGVTAAEPVVTEPDRVAPIAEPPRKIRVPRQADAEVAAEVKHLIALYLAEPNQPNAYDFVVQRYAKGDRNANGSAFIAAYINADEQYRRKFRGWHMQQMKEAA